MDKAKFVNFNHGFEDSNSIISRIKSAGSNLNSTTGIIIGTVILFAIIAAIYYFYYFAPQMNAKYKPNSEQVHETGTNNTAELLFFYADWCPHCKTAKPIWNDLKTEYENKTINGYKVVFTEINCS